MEFKEKSIELYSLVLKDLIMATAQLNQDAVRYISFTGGLLTELGIYDEVLQDMIGKMTPEEIEIFLKFEKDLENWFSGKEVNKDE